MFSESFTLSQWLAHRKYSRASWYRLKASGNAPETIGSGRLQRITAEADEAWLRKQEREAKESRAA